MGPLETRIATGIVLAAGIIAAVVLLPPAGFALLVWLVLLLAAWEWGALLGLSRPVGRLIYLLMVSAVVGMLWLAREVDGMIWLAIGPAVAFWLIAALAMAWYRQAGIPQLPALAWELGGFVVLVPPVIALITLQAAGPGWVLYLLLLVAAGDTAAYFAGRRWGKSRLAPGISPGKTWAGLAGAMVAGVAFALATAPLMGLAAGSWPLWILVAVVTVVFSVCGDLLESTLKRQRGVKDSGTILPGHGGVLDRIDSITAAAPVFVAALEVVKL